jgi:hypothetical protein
MPDTPKPEARDSGQHFALARDGLGQNHVEGRKAVAGDYQQVIGVDLVDIADLAAMEELELAQLGFIEG